MEISYMASERCLLHIAVTRAKKKVGNSAYGAASEFHGHQDL